MLAVVFKDETGEKKVHGLETQKVFTVGRGNAAAPDQEPTHVRIRHASVSRQHAEFYEADDGNWCVRDVGSSNHTFLNGEQIDVAYVQEGDVIRFGDFTVKVETVPDPAPAGRKSRVQAAAPAPVKAAPPPEPEPVPQASGRRARNDAPLADDPVARRKAAAEPIVPPKAVAPPPSRKAAPPPPEPEPEPEYEEEEPEPEPEPAPPPRRSRAPEPEPPRKVEPPPQAGGRRPRNAEPEPEPPKRRAPPPPEPEPEPEPEPAPVARRVSAADDQSLRRAAPKAASGVVGVDPAEFRAVQDKANKLEDTLREERKKYEEAQRRILDLEARDGRHEDEMREWQDRYDKAREQTDHMQELLERARDDNKEHEENTENFEREIAELESQLKQFEASKGETTDLLSDLKSKAVQKDRRIDELQRELDMMEFDLRNAREELESVQNSMNFENTETRKLERELTLLREVIHEKENHAKSLQLEIEERDKEIYDLKLGTGVKDLQQAKTEMMEKYFAKDKEHSEMRERLLKAEMELKAAKGELADAHESAKETKDYSTHPEFKRKERELSRALADADNARDELEKIQEKLTQFSPEVKAKLEAERDTLRKKVATLEEKVDELESGGAAKDAADAENSSNRRKIISLESKVTELEEELKSARKEARGAKDAAAAATTAGGEGDAALKKQIGILEDKADELSLDLRKAKAEIERWKGDAEKAKADADKAKADADKAKAAAAVPAPKANGFDKDSALDSLDAIQDLYRSWMSNLQVLKTYGEDIDTAKDNAKKVRDAIDGIGQTLNSIEKDANDMRSELKTLRGALDKG